MHHGLSYTTLACPCSNPSFLEASPRPAPFHANKRQTPTAPTSDLTHI